MFDAFVSSWSVSRKTMNRMQHAIMGNGGGNKGKGKGRMSVQVDPEMEFARSMREAIPEAAKIRAQPKLLQEQWNQTIKEWQHLDSSGGVAIASKEAIPKILERVGYSSKPVAILVVQEPDDIGMMAYPRSRVRCTYDVASTGGMRKHVEVDRWLVQLGFAEQVAMKPAGEEVKVGFTMIRMIAKLSPLRGWSHGPHPGGVLTNHLKQFVDEHAFDAVVPREDGSFLFLVHNVLEEVLLSKSGKQGIFLKRHNSEPDAGHELLWLDPEISLDDALLVAESAGALGVVEKGNKGRLALRFRSVEDITTFAKSNKYDFDASLQRWKVTGVPLQAGIQGLSHMLCSLGWKVAEIVYQSENSAVFTTSNKGKEAPAHVRYLGQPRRIQFKALNAAAKQEAAKVSKASRGSGSDGGSGFDLGARAKAQQAFLQKLAAAAPEQIPIPVDSPKGSPRATDATKRPNDGNTGETPGPKR